GRPAHHGLRARARRRVLPLRRGGGGRAARSREGGHDPPADAPLRSRGPGEFINSPRRANKPRVLRRAGSLLFWTFMAVSSIVLFPVALLLWAATVLFDRRLRVLHRFTCFWASLYTWLNPAWRVHTEGRDKIRPGATYVMVANHQSFLDILVLFRLFVHFKWVS